ncbi:MAG: caspase family protein [Deltaproteobacteria bacterium]|nr:caspase family protein [Deltaproteobacteria bacterium]
MFVPFLFLALVAHFLSSAPALAQTPRAERPTYTVGDKWILGGGVYDLIRIENDLYIFAAEGGWEIHLTKDLTVAKVQRGMSAYDFVPPPRLAWPLEVGKSGSGLSFWTTPRGQGRIYINWKVEAYEDIEVPAGRFKAFRIVYSFEVGPPGQRQPRVFSTWYAPEAQRIVKAQGQYLPLLNFQVVAVDRPDLAPLQVVLREPKEQARVNTEGIVVAGKATSGKGVARVTAALNGAEIYSHDEKPSPKSEVPLDLPVKLREGRNVLIVTALDATGETRQEARTLFYEKIAPPIPEPPKVAPTPSPAALPPAIAKPVAPVTPALEEALKKQLEEERKKAAEIALKAEKERGRLEEAQKRLKEERSRAEELASLPPLKVAISSPRDQARVKNESIGLAGLVTSGREIGRVIVTLNGVELSRLEEKSRQRSLAVNLPVKLRDGQNTLVITAADTGGAIHQEVRTVHYEKLVPLTVAFRYPEDRARVSEEASVVAAVVTSSKGVGKVSVSLNGSEVHQQSERTPQKSVAVAVPVALREGANAVVISASEPDGNIRQEIRTVIYERPRVVMEETKTPRPPPTRDRWAVVIGVGRYESPEIPRLRYTVPDAEALYDVLIGPAGFKKEHVLLITDKTEKKPTLRNIKWALGTFLARSAKKDDTVVIYFAGHGAPEVDQQGVERDGFAKYMVPGDAEPDDLYSTGLPMDELQTIFARIEAERVVVFLDSCYSGAAGGRTFASKKTRSGHVDDLFLERLTRSKGRAIITASRPTEVSIELPDLGHGIFTYYLVQGLKGAGDLNRDGIVSLQELYEYVEQQVTQKSRAVGGNQHPVMKGELEGALPLVKVSVK